ncbi:MAG: hypothetical protein UY77_C0006G0011 [Candidatus Uhrbacteria bacterium GW2011_GWA2_53_10]|uniref:Transcriptional repressor PaaX-like central Cas2-like domain-containing protein n=1 Tax=Candidatus Uhrbacteria bacterium GW2011_GWA2_53_10 TaxID=1618980 RepID=A0A0G2AKC5_9BACT|nr:MAG: hypothetical protein UY77_C0006G0011 [Candidatus Uhrbacteria bacterium GW2011_GWA2_53_10]
MIILLSKDALVVQMKRHIRETKIKLLSGDRCLVIFDFPVGTNQARQSLRVFLISSGFRREQLSVWVSDKDVMLSMRALIRLLGIEPWVKICRAVEV